MPRGRPASYLQALSNARRTPYWAFTARVDQPCRRFESLADAARWVQGKQAKRRAIDSTASVISRASRTRERVYGYYWRHETMVGEIDLCGMLEQTTSKAHSYDYRPTIARDELAARLPQWERERVTELLAEIARGNASNSAAAPRIIIPLVDDFA